MPKQPAKNLPRSPSRSTYWLARNRTTACDTVSRTVGSLCGALNADALETMRHSPSMQGQPGVDGLVFPGVAQPSVLGVVDDLPGPFLARACHHVEVVHVVAGRCYRRPVIPVGDKHDVTAAHLLEDLDRPARCAVHTVIAEAARIIWAGGDLEVVDLLE